MTQDERNTQLQRENTTLRQKVVELEARVNSLSESVLMADVLLKAKDEQISSLENSLDSLVTELTARDEEIKFLTSKVA